MLNLLNRTMTYSRAEKPLHKTFEKPLFHLKMYLKCLAVLEKVSIFLKKSKNILNLYKNPTFLNRILNYSGNIFKKTRYVYKILILIEYKPPFF
jgi:hypothetical protein